MIRKRQKTAGSTRNGSQPGWHTLWSQQRWCSPQFFGRSVHNRGHPLLLDCDPVSGYRSTGREHQIPGVLLAGTIRLL